MQTVTLTRKLLRRLLKPVGAMTVNGMFCWIQHKDWSEKTNLHDTVIMSVRAFDRRKVNLKLLDLLGRKLGPDGIHTEIGLIQFYRLEPIDIRQ